MAAGHQACGAGDGGVLGHGDRRYGHQLPGGDRTRLVRALGLEQKIRFGHHAGDPTFLRQDGQGADPPLPHGLHDVLERCSAVDGDDGMGHHVLDGAKVLHDASIAAS